MRRRWPCGCWNVIIVLSIFIVHRLVPRMYTEFSRTHVYNVDRKYVFANLHTSNVFQRTIKSAAMSAFELALEQSYYRRQATIVNPFQYTMITTPRIACPHDVFLIIVIHSHPTYRDRRDAIRRTWGRYGNGHVAANQRTRLVFSLGVDTNVSADTIRSESDIYDDIIQGNFNDVYRNLTLKSLMGLKWVSENCDRDTVPYMLKSDDDMFIEIPYLIEILLTRRPTRSIMGPLNTQSSVRRTGKWALTKKVFPFDWYPPYESGSCYVISNDIVRELYETSAYVTPIFIDDVYVTGILARIIGANHIRQTGFVKGKRDATTAPVARDFVSRGRIAGTQVTPDLMYKLWKEVNSANITRQTPSPRAAASLKKFALTNVYYK